MNQQIKFKKNLILKRIIFIAMILVTFFTIFNFSAQNGKESGNVSHKVTTVIVKVVVKNEASREKYIEKLEPVVRKLAHFSIYTVAGFAIMGMFCTFDIKNKYKLIFSLLIGVAYAVSDEIHQMYTPGRGPSIIDVGIDSLGVLTGIFIMIILIILFENISNWLKR